MVKSDQRRSRTAASRLKTICDIPQSGFDFVGIYALTVARAQDIPETDEASWDSEPPMSLDKFIEESGLSSTTIWRFRKKGFLRTVNICGRHYVLRSEIARFNARASAGEFEKACHRPLKKACVSTFQKRTVAP